MVLSTWNFKYTKQLQSTKRISFYCTIHFRSLFLLVCFFSEMHFHKTGLYHAQICLRFVRFIFSKE